MEALGTEDADFAQELVLQLSYAHSRGDEAELNFLLSVIKGVKPKDQLEAMLAAQMAVTHSLTMTFAHRLNHVQNIQQQDSAERAFNKLARTFTAQMEALKRHRTGGDQKVTVQQVSVSEGDKRSSATLRSLCVGPHQTRPRRHQNRRASNESST
jgi:hypothetical protein